MLRRRWVRVTISFLGFALPAQACDGTIDGSPLAEDAGVAPTTPSDAGSTKAPEDGGLTATVDAAPDVTDVSDAYASDAALEAAPSCVSTVPDAGDGGAKRCNLVACSADADCASNVCDDKICYGGSGTLADPWQIGGPITLELLRTRGTKKEFFVLERDIDLSSRSVAPIDAFVGTLDGKGHAIQHWAFASSGEINDGFFRTLDGRIERLSLTDFTLTATNNGMVGGLVGSVTGSARVHDCHVTGTIDLGASQTAFDVGGLVGAVTYKSFATRPVAVCAAVNVGAVGFLITSSSADVEIKGQAYSGGLVGGLVGGNEGGRLTVMDSFARGSISAVTPHAGTAMPGKGGLTGGASQSGTINVFRSYAAVAMPTRWPPAAADSPPPTRTAARWRASGTKP